MRVRTTSDLFPKYIWALLVIYFVASLAHFIHNAEYIVFYPNMPSWITRDTVYWVWLGICSIGVAGIVISRMGLTLTGMILLATYGAFGLDGLGHYTLALCSEHTLAMNVTIWAEAISGLVFALCCIVLAGRALTTTVKARSAW